MNVLKKSKSMAGVLFAIAIALVSCQEKVDVLAPLGGIADEKIPATYSYTVIDTATFTATVYEYTFVSDEETNEKTGSYLVTSLTGDGKATRVEKTFTYVRGAMTEDNLYYNVELTFEDGTKSTVKWGSASIVDDQFTHNGTKRADHLITISDALPNKTWEFESKVLYIDTIRTKVYYMNFVSAVDYLTQQQIDSINAWMKSAEGKEAVAWWNENLELIGKKASDKITRDTVRVFYNLEENGAYKSQYYHWNQDSIVSIKYDTLGAKVTEAKTFICNFKSGQANTGRYTYVKTEYGRDYYEKSNTSDKKVTTEDLSFKHWGVAFNGTLLNAKTLSVVAEVRDEVAGADKPGYKVFAIKGLDPKKGEVTIDDVNYKEATE